MTNPNWGLAMGGGFQNALAQGLQFGQMARQRAEEKATDNALAAFAANPDDPQALPGLIKANPRLGLQVAEDQRKRTAEAAEADIRRRAAGGDPEATAKLAGIDFGAWRGLQADQKAAARERAGVLGNAALDVLNRPPEQRAVAWDAYIDQLSQTMPELAQYRGQYSEQSARSVIAQAEMIGKLHDMEQPDYMAVPYDATLVNTRDPASLAQFAQGGQPEVREGATATNPQTGARIVFRNGQWVPAEGGAVGSSLGSNFLEGL